MRPSSTRLRAALVAGRDRELRIETLGAGRDRRCHVRSLRAANVYSRWLVARAGFVGEAVLLADGFGHRVRSVVDGTGSFAIGESRLIGIVDPNDPDEPALWLSWDLDAIAIEPVAPTTSSCLPPRTLLLRDDGVELALSGVVQVLGRSSYRADREDQFVTAVRHTRG